MFEMSRKVTDLGRFGFRTLIYSVVVDEGVEGLEGAEEGLKNYGVMIQVEESGEQTAVRGITTVREKAMRLLDLLASNYVTPIALSDVVYDWLCV